MNYLSSNDTKTLYKAFLSLENEEECKKFLRDLLTKEEIQEFTNRFKVAQMLTNKISYKKIEKETGMSSTTIARVSKWLSKGMGGYQLVINKLKSPTQHYTQPPILKTTEVQKHQPTPPSGGVIFGG